MNENAKKASVVVLAVAALGAAVFSGLKLMAPPALEQGVVHRSPAKSMAQMERERMQREDAVAASGIGAAAERNGDADAALAGAR